MGGINIIDQMAEVEWARSCVACEVPSRSWDFILSNNSTLVVQWQMLTEPV